MCNGTLVTVYFDKMCFVIIHWQETVQRRERTNLRRGETQNDRRDDQIRGHHMITEETEKLKTREGKNSLVINTYFCVKLA